MLGRGVRTPGRMGVVVVGGVTGVKMGAGGAPWNTGSTNMNPFASARGAIKTVAANDARTAYDMVLLRIAKPRSKKGVVGRDASFGKSDPVRVSWDSLVITGV